MVRSIDVFAAVARGGILEALVENHADVASESELHVDSRLGREHMRRPVEVRLEQHPIFGNLPQGIQAEYLKATGVGQNRSRPLHELVQPAERPHRLVPRPKEEVIRVRQNDRRIDFIQQLLRRNALHRRLRPDRHKDRRRNDAVIGVDQPRSCPRNGTLRLNFKTHLKSA